MSKKPTLEEVVTQRLEEINILFHKGRGDTRLENKASYCHNVLASIEANKQLVALGLEISELSRHYEEAKAKLEAMGQAADLREIDAGDLLAVAAANTAVLAEREALAAVTRELKRRLTARKAAKRALWQKMKGMARLDLARKQFGLEEE